MLKNKNCIYIINVCFYQLAPIFVVLQFLPSCTGQYWNFLLPSLSPPTVPTYIGNIEIENQTEEMLFYIENGEEGGSSFYDVKKYYVHRYSLL